MQKDVWESVDYWSIYKAINFWRLSANTKFVDAKTGKEYTYTFVGADQMRKSFFFAFFSCILWMSPALIIVYTTALFWYSHPWAYLVGILAVTLYHFAGMYYCIRGALIQIHSAKKKWLFSRK